MEPKENKKNTVKAKGRYIKITEEVFDMIKLMLESGASQTKIARVMGISSATATYIKRANTYTEYKEIMLNASGGHKKKVKREEEAKKAEEEAKKAEEEAKEEVVADKEEPKPEPATQVIEHRETISLIANQFIAEQMRKQTELLTLINNKLTLIAEDLGCFRDEKASNE